MDEDSSQLAWINYSGDPGRTTEPGLRKAIRRHVAKRQHCASRSWWYEEKLERPLAPKSEFLCVAEHLSPTQTKAHSDTTEEQIAGKVWGDTIDMNAQAIGSTDDGQSQCMPVQRQDQDGLGIVTRVCSSASNTAADTSAHEGIEDMLGISRTCWSADENMSCFYTGDGPAAYQNPSHHAGIHFEGACGDSTSRHSRSDSEEKIRNGDIGSEHRACQSPEVESPAQDEGRKYNKNDHIRDTDCLLVNVRDHTHEDNIAPPHCLYAESVRRHRAEQIQFGFDRPAGGHITESESDEADDICDKECHEHRNDDCSNHSRSCDGIQSATSSCVSNCSTPDRSESTPKFDKCQRIQSVASSQMHSTGNGITNCVNNFHETLQWRCLIQSPDPGFRCNRVFSSFAHLQRHRIERHCYFRCKLCNGFDRLEYKAEHEARHRHGLSTLQECAFCGDRVEPSPEHECFTEQPSFDTTFGEPNQELTSNHDRTVLDFGDSPALTLAYGLGLAVDRGCAGTLRSG